MSDASRFVHSHDDDLKRQILDSCDTFVFDCDGVLWNGDVPLKGARDLLHLLRREGKRILYVSNNSSKSRAAYLGKFASLDFPADEESVFSSAYAAAYYVKHIAKLPEDKKVYVVGMHGICAELEAVGVKWCGSSQDNGKAKLDEIGPEDEIGAVLLGFDSDISYFKLARAFYHLNTRKDVLFLATNDGMLISRSVGQRQRALTFRLYRRHVPASWLSIPRNRFPPLRFENIPWPRT